MNESDFYWFLCPGCGSPVPWPKDAAIVGTAASVSCSDCGVRTRKDIAIEMGKKVEKDRLRAMARQPFVDPVAGVIDG